MSDEGLLRAAEQAVAAWDAYIEAHADRGHEGPHVPDPKLSGDCGACVVAQYGTEVEMGEYAMPALRDILANPDAALDAVTENLISASRDGLPTADLERRYAALAARSEPRGEGLREAVEDDIMRRMSSDNPRSRQHDEATADRHRMWRCIPIEDAVAARSALLAIAATPPAPALDWDDERDIRWHQQPRLIPALAPERQETPPDV